MTGYISSKFRHECATRGCYLQQQPNWEHLFGAFPRGIRPTDVDGMVEIGGHFLFLEEKSAGAGPDEGQRLALRRLSMLPRVTVVFFRPGTSSDLEVLTYGGSHEPTGWQPNTNERFRQRLAQWAIRSDSPPQKLTA